MKRLILGFAESRKRIIDSLDNQVPVVLEHLAKCAYYPNSDSFAHWCTEVRAALWYVPAMKGSNRYPGKELIYRSCVSNHQQMIQALTDGTYEDHGPTDINPDKVKDIIYKYFQWLSDMLSTRGRVTMKEVQGKMEELCKHK